MLVNMNSQPTVSKKIANVKTSDSKYTVDKVVGIPVAYVSSSGPAALLWHMSYDPNKCA